MKKNRGGRKRLGDEKRTHEIKLRFNSEELLIIQNIVTSYNLDFERRGVMGPFLRRLLLNGKTVKSKKLPEMSANLIYQINKIGTNINQLTAVARSKNLRNPSAKLDAEIEKSNILLDKTFKLLKKKLV